MAGDGELRRMRAVSPYTRAPRYGSQLIHHFVQGFGIFFAIFEVTRRVALHARYLSETAVETLRTDTSEALTVKQHAPRTIHGIALVTGGVTAGLAYEICSRPFDVMRRAVHLERLTVNNPGPTKPLTSLVTAVAHKFRDDGFLSFFRDPTKVVDDTPVATREGVRRRLYAASRMLARLGPWGVGFLVWESLGPGIA